MFWCDFKCRWCSVWSCEQEECEKEDDNMTEKIGKDLVKIGVSQEDLEDSINGLSQLKPILQALVIKSNGADRRQAAIDSTTLGRHFDTAIDAMAMLLSGFPDYQ